MSYANPLTVVSPSGLGLQTMSGDLVSIYRSPGTFFLDTKEEDSNQEFMSEEEGEETWLSEKANKKPSP